MNNFDLKEWNDRILDKYTDCLTCEKKLSHKDLKKGLIRCKKCHREYGKVWPEGERDFYDMFKGQM